MYFLKAIKPNTAEIIIPTLYIKVKPEYHNNIVIDLIDAGFTLSKISSDTYYSKIKAHTPQIEYLLISLFCSNSVAQFNEVIQNVNKH